jgi:hypothetical protein
MFERIVARSIHFGKRAALAFGLAAVSAIVLAASVSDNGVAQILITLFAAIALWAPMLIALLWGERALRRRPAPPAPIDAVARDRSAAHWRRLALAAPDQRERIQGLERSIERSQRKLRAARLDPEAHDLCILIDKRLPDLIDRELDALPPDDRGRRERIDGLIKLVDQFVRHCGKHGQSDDAGHDREAEILRRRFEQRLAASPFESQ